jgi:hypothetical protein
VSLKKTLGKVLLFLVLEAGAFFGVPMSPREIEELMQTLSRTHHEQVIRSEKDDDLGD